MAATKDNSRSDAKKAAFEAAYSAALSGKPLSQGAVNKIYDQTLDQAKKETAGTAQPKVHIADSAKKLGKQAASAAKPVTDTVDILKKLIGNQRGSANQQTTQGPVSASAGNYQTADALKKAREDYTASEEYAGKKKERDDMTAAMQNAVDMSDTPDAFKYLFQPDGDQKEENLRAAENYYRAQGDAAAEDEVMQKDMAEFESWPEEDRKLLTSYLNNRQNSIYDHSRILNGETPVDIYGEAKPLFDKYGSDRVAEIAESYNRSQNRKMVEGMTEFAQGSAEKHPVVSSAGSIVANLMGSGLSSAIGYADEASQRTGRYKSLDPNNMGNLADIYSGAVRGQVTSKLEGGEENTNGLAGKALATGYQAGMSALESLARVAAFGDVGSLALASTNAFGQTMREASANGASPEQAVALGVIDGGLEVLTEKVSLDNLLKNAGTPQKGTEIVKKILTQGGVEVTEEAASFLGSTLAEAAILQDNSSYNRQIGELVAGGMSYDEAKKQAQLDLVKEAGNTAIQSFLSGSMMSGAETAVSAAMGRGAENGTVQEEEAAPTAPAADEAQQVIDAVAAELAQQAPQPEAQPVTPEMEQLNAAIAETLGVQPAQQPTVDTAPAAEYDNNISPDLGASIGKSDVAYTSDNQRVPFRYAVVPAESLITSNDQFGNVNSAYPAELQPRDRARAASQMQINKMAANLNPELLGESKTAENGAPIIRGDGVVIGGNARANAISMVYGSGRGAEYQQFVTGKAAELGIDPATLPANPVLVRITDGMDNYAGLATALNETGVKSNSPAETAKIDASKMGDIIQYLSVGDDGNLDSAENHEFIQQFTSNVVPAGEQDTVMQGNSQVSQSGIRRMQYALFYYAYGDTALVERLAESTDNNAKNITNAMVGAAGKVAKLQTEIGRGEVQDFGLQSAITNAVNLYLDAKAGKQTVSDAAGQLTMGGNGPEAQYDGLTVNLAMFMESNNRSGKQIRDFIDILIDVNMNATADTASQLSMFGNGDQQTQEGFYDEAVTAYDQQRDGKGRIPEKSDFSQYRQYRGGELAAVVDGSGTEGSTGEAQLHGGSAATVSENAPGGQRQVTGENGTDGYGQNTVGSAESRFKHETRRSKVYDNTYANATDENIRDVGSEAEGADPRVAEYDYISEEESVHNAELRTGTKDDIDSEYDYLLNKEGWSGEDNDTAFRVLDSLRKAGDTKRLAELAKVQRREGTTGGQFVQSFAKYSRTPTKAACDAVQTMDGFEKEDVSRRYWKKKDFSSWKDDINKSILEIANEIDNVPEGDAEGMRDIVRQLAAFRRTTAWAGTTNRLTKAADRMVNKLDYETAKDIATSQLGMIPNDFRKHSTSEMVKTVRVQNMLSALTTVNRNLAGNASTGIMDSLSDSTGGRMMDAIMAKFTGKRTVGNDVKYAGEYFRAAKDAADMASLCVELDIPMETEAAYSTGQTRNYSPNSGMVGRFFSAYEKYLKYALEVSDKFFEGGTSGAVSKSLESLGAKSGLSQAEIDSLSQKAGERRTFKEGRKAAQVNAKLKETLNVIGNGEFGAGDLLVPFANVPGDVAQVGIDYSGGGLIEGLTEISGIIKDAKAGKEIDTYRQRKAATDFGRGMTGAGLIATFTALAASGIVGVHDDPDKDKRGLEQSLGLSGAQLNVDAMLRALKDEDTAWKDGDLTVSVDFLEPFNSQMYIGYLLSQEDSLMDMLKAYPGSSFRGILQSVLDMPMMQTFSDVADIATSFTEVSEDGNLDAVWDAVGQMAGNTATGFIPSWMRQTAQYMDPYYRDTSGDDAMQKAINQVTAALPGLSQTLPKKYDGLGNEQRRYDDPVSGFFNTFINPGEAERIKGNEVADYLLELSDSTGDLTIYPEYLAPKSFKVNGEDVLVSGKEMTETYQKTYGDHITALYGGLMNSPGFSELPEDMQVSALKKAKEYATQFAKASVSDYKGQLDDLEGMSAEKQASVIVRKTISSGFSDAFSDITKAWGDGTDPAEAMASLDQMYGVYKGLSTAEQNSFKADNGGRVAYYLDARSKGVSTETFTGLYKTYYNLDKRKDLDTSQKAQEWARTLEKAADTGKITESQKNVIKGDMMFRYSMPAETAKFDEMVGSGVRTDDADMIVKLLDGITPQEGYSTVRDVQKAEAIAGSNLSESNKAAAMKTYLPDSQDENLDQMMGMGYSVQDYAAALKIYANESGAGKKSRIIGQYEKLFGVSKAKEIYDIYG